MALICRNCGGALPPPAGAQELTCAYCGASKRLELTAVQSMELALARRHEFDPWMKALMERYADALGAGDKGEAMRFFEPFQYFVGALSFEVEELEELEAWAKPLLESTARELGLDFQSAAERGVVVSWDYARGLASGPRPE